MNQPKIALNTMVVTDCFHREDLESILKKVARLGVDSVEISQHIPFAGTDAFRMKQTGMPGVCGFSVQMDGPVENPVPPMTFEGKPIETFGARRDFARVVELCRQMDCPYLRFAGLPGAALTDWETLAAYLEDLEELALEYRQAGLNLCLHNHTDEFIRVQKAGVSPVALLERCAGRAPLVHLQDMGVFPSPKGEWMRPEFRSVALGQGNLPLGEIWRTACRTGVEYLVIEQWPLYGRDPYREIAVSAAALRTLAQGQE